MRVMIKENENNVLYGVKKAYYEKHKNSVSMFLELDTGKTIEIEFESQAEFEHRFSQLFVNGSSNLNQYTYTVIE